MKYFSLYVTIVVLFINCKKVEHNTGIAQKSNTQIDSVIKNSKKDGVAFLTEFYTKYYGENKSRENIANYVSNRILNRMDSLTIADNLILDYDPFIYGQDWDEKVLIKSLKIKPLKNDNQYSVSFFKFDKNDKERTNIDILLQDNEKGKLLIYSILSDEYLNFKTTRVDNNSTKTDNRSSSTIVVQYDYDLNSDGIIDKIILYQNDEEKGEFEKKHFGLPMEIKRGLPNNTYQTWYTNDLIIPKNNFNCATEGFNTIVFKDNYFTIENQICSDYIEISSYTTFKVIGRNIILHKYGETYFDKAEHDRQIPSKTWGIKDFTNVNFEDVTDDFLIKLSQTKPQKEL
jgi:hypothetical protein